jgi:aryl-alcohol dehydrogenase-like predicted oxidoreductase
MLPGWATAAGTARYRARFPGLAAAGHFRQHPHVAGAEGLWLSSLGLGTYLGAPDEAGDAAYREAIERALGSGINLLDTAINYRHQRSERNLGEVLERMCAAGLLVRDEFLVCTKAGYLTFDAEQPADPGAYFRREYVERGVLDPKQIAAGMHCMAPRYLADQMERSRRNLRCATLDVFYVHNPETQLSEVPRDEFRRRVTAAFRRLEQAVAEEKIRFYGVATWSGFRVPPEAREHLSLAELAAGARQAAGGDGHHFRFIQLPFNLAMPEGWALRNQSVDGEAERGSTFEAARREGIAVVGSAALHQGALARDLPAFLAEKLGTQSDAATAIQFARSAPGLAAALVGMSSAGHVEENLQVARMPPAAQAEWKALFKK